MDNSTYSTHLEQHEFFKVNSSTLNDKLNQLIFNYINQHCTFFSIFVTESRRRNNCLDN
ncbi:MULTISPECIES: hypothetical protein [Niallia]|uniref:Uncharacterized protein n=1 Tax=Niallia circulans TaxID=1397 RepID=A0A941GBC4_NIACI|nr:MULTISPECIES: hypothetical protein [Niallia]MCB5237197.1 hypothetical protein [Niallia circulans]MED3795639.1 hypothetical protein [Niallia alba]